jgi:hypothetical protein
LAGKGVAMTSSVERVVGVALMILRLALGALFDC